MSIQIPNLHTSNLSLLRTKDASVVITERKSAVNAGQFIVSGSLQMQAGNPYGVPTLFSITTDLSDSLCGPNTKFDFKTVEQIDTLGRDTPTLFATGRCSADVAEKGLRYWLMVCNNRPKSVRDTRDVIGFVIFDRFGVRVAYGTGPVIRGAVHVDPGE
jgi:hypothetical protein